jgi:hypothetical protein
MALALVKEDGTGRADANSYASAADGDAYHDGHLYASAWTAATVENKEKALVMASRLIDSQYQFNGFKVSGGQALQWPRISCPDPDVNATELVGILWRAGNYVDSNIVPKVVVDSTCELARELLVSDRTAAPPGEGLRYENTSTLEQGFDKTDRRRVIPRVVQAMLGKYGQLLSAGSGNVRLMRV